MLDQLPRISESEWVVMKELWSRHPLTAGEVVASLEGRTAWGPATIKTLLNRLVGKGALGFEKRGREYLYRPLVTEEECVRAESSSFLKRVFGGALTPMLAAFIEREELSPDDLAHLKRMLQEKEGKADATRD